MMRRRWIITTLVSLILNLLFTSFSYGAKKRALLIGINDYKNLPYFSRYSRRMLTDLRGPLNDIQMMEEILTSRYGFRRDDIKVLKDNEATRDNIIKTFKSWLINGTKKGDMVFFHFSGHGTQISDQNADEIDGKDEALCAYDVVLEGARNVIEAHIIIDDELGAMFRKLQNRDVVAFIDACHSATVATRSINMVPVTTLEQTPAYYSRFIPVEIKELHTKARDFSMDIPKQSDIPPGQVFLYSSKEDQISLELSFPDGFHGVLSNAIVEGMRNKKDITYLKLHEYTVKTIKDRHKLEQDPQIEPQKGKILERSVFTFTLPLPLPLPEQKPKPPKPIVKPEQPAQAQPEPKPHLPTPQITTPLKPNIPQPPPEVKEEKVLLRIEAFHGGDASLTKKLKESLKTLPYVKLTAGDFFDRLLRGEVKSGMYHARLLNRVGDVIPINPAKSLPELTEAVTPHLESEYILKQLAHIHHPNPPFKVKVWVTDEKRRDFRIGEKIEFNFYSEIDCHILLLNMDSKGNFHIIFPNRYYSDNSISGGQTITIPDERMKKEFLFEFGEPAGEETVKVIASKESLNLEDLGIEKFKQLFDKEDMISLPEKKRLIFVKRVSKALSSGKFIWSEDTVIIRSHNE